MSHTIKLDRVVLKEIDLTKNNSKYCINFKDSNTIRIGIDYIYIGKLLSQDTTVVIQLTKPSKEELEELLYAKAYLVLNNTPLEICLIDNRYIIIKDE